MVRLRLVAYVAALLALPLACGRADTLPPLTADQSASLGRTLRLWTRGVLGERPQFTATPADGHYDLQVPMKGELAGLDVALDGAPATAHAILDDAGRWHFDAITYPSPLRTTMPVPGGDTATQTVQTIREQSGSAVIDPTLATPSHWETALSGIEQRGDASKVPTTVTIAHAATHEEWLPVSPGRVDTAMVSRTEDVALHARGGPGPADKPRPDVEMTVRTATLAVQSSDVDLDRASQFVGQAVAFVGTTHVRDQKALTMEQRADLHRIVVLSRDLAREVKVSFAADGLAVAVGGRRVTADRLVFDQKMAAPEGKLDLRLRLELAGLGLPDRLPPAIQAMIPRHVAIAPYVTGTPVEDAYALANEWIDGESGANSVAEDAGTRLAKAPVTVGIEELAFDLGPASITGKGQVTAGGPHDVDGTAVIQATGVDALVRKASADPLLKRAVPVLIFLKGIGDQNGDKTVWNLEYKDAKFTVNGTDMSGFVPGK